MPDEAEPMLAKEVLRYCMKHPKAADTPEGFARWRLAQETAPRATIQIEEALAWLAAAGYLREVAVTGGVPLYALNADQLEAAEKFLSTTKTGGADGGR